MSPRALSLLRVAPGVRRAVLAGAVGTVLCGAVASPAQACSEEALHLKVTVTSSSPVVDARVAEHGGELTVRVRPGHAATVAGVQGEPWLRFDPDGTVALNRNAPSTHTSCAMPEECDAPPQARLGAAPDWQTLIPKGEFTVYDSRTRPWQSELPADLLAAPGQTRTLRRYTVPVTVDGTAHTLTGTVTWTPGPDEDEGAPAGPVGRIWAVLTFAPAASAAIGAGVLVLAAGAGGVLRRARRANATPTDAAAAEAAH